MAWRRFGLDHAVHLVADLDGAAGFFESLGFTVRQRNRHPFGTHNRLVVFDNTYVELLAIAEPDRLPDPAAGYRGFAGFAAGAWQTFGEGFHLLALRGHDVESDRAQLAEAGLRLHPPQRFARQREDGTEVRFALLFPAYDASDSPIFHCVHETPDGVYGRPVTHANGAQALDNVYFASDSPADHHAYLGQITGERDMHSTSAGVFFDLERGGRLSVLSPAAHERFFGRAPALSGTRLRAQGYEIAVADLAPAETALKRAGRPYHLRDNRLIMPPETAFGATVVLRRPAS